MTAHCNNSMLRRATRMLGQLYDDELGPSGLKATQHGLLFEIQEMKGPSLKDLSVAIVMDLSALSHTLKPLIRDGFVALVADEHDGRVKRVTLTMAGVKKLNETMRLWRKAQDRFESLFGEKRAAGLRAVLAELSSAEFRQAFKERDRQG